MKHSPLVCVAFAIAFSIQLECVAQQTVFPILQTTPSNFSSGDFVGQGAINTGAIQGFPNYISPSMAAPSWPTMPGTTDPFNACSCPPSSTQPCDCKNLSCRIQLPSGCKTFRPTRKEPVPCRILGEIPKITVASDCRKKITDFLFDTEVPQVHCKTECCDEIDKKTIQCLPGCCFTVCVPANKCTTEVVECALVSKPMKMELWQRKSSTRGVVYDVYVINDPDVNSPFHAGGMPEKWLLLHCASAQQVRQRFPNSVRANGSPLVKSAKGAKPKKTKADVPIKLILEQAKAKPTESSEQKPVIGDVNSEG